MSELNDSNGRVAHPSDEDIDFLDRILQDLFGTALKLQYSLSVLEETPAQARLGIEDAMSSLSDMMEPIRERVHMLDGSRNLSGESRRQESK